MQRTVKALALLALASALGAGAAVASGQGNPYNLPDEVKTTSIKIPRGTPETQAAFLKLARVGQQQAEAAALAVQPGQVVKARLDDEHDHLVWQIDIKHDNRVTEFAVDPGTGKVIAAESDAHDDRR